MLVGARAKGSSKGLGLWRGTIAAGGLLGRDGTLCSVEEWFFLRPRGELGWTIMVVTDDRRWLG